MRGIGVGVLILLLAGCMPSATDGSPNESVQSSTTPVSPEEPSALPSMPSGEPSEAPSGEVSAPEFVTVTFRLLLTGSVPADASFALESGPVGGGGGAVYLCSYYGGWPVCASSGTYEEELAFFSPGTRVRYRFWRELDVNGATEEIEAGEFTVGLTDQVISVSYEIQP